MFIEIKEPEARFMNKLLPPINDDKKLLQSDLSQWAFGNRAVKAECATLTTNAIKNLNNSIINGEYEYIFDENEVIEVLNNMYNNKVVSKQRERHFANVIAFRSLNGNGIKIVPTGGFTKTIAKDFDVYLSTSAHGNNGRYISVDTKYNIPMFRAEQHLLNDLEPFSSKIDKDDLYLDENPNKNGFGSKDFKFKLSVNGNRKVEAGMPININPELTTDISQWTWMLYIMFKYKGSPESIATYKI